MKAIVCTRYGKTEDVVEMRDMPTPVVQANDVDQSPLRQLESD